MSRRKLCLGLIAAAAAPAALGAASAADGFSNAAFGPAFVAGEVRWLAAAQPERTLIRKSSAAGSVAIATQRLDLHKLTPADFGDSAADDAR